MLSEQNLIDRCGRIPASGIGKIRRGGKDRKDLINSIGRERITGKVETFPGNVYMQYGADNEAPAFEKFKNKYYEATPNDNFYKYDFKAKCGTICLVGATPDGLFNDGQPVEIKSPYSQENYEAQVALAAEVQKDMSGNFKSVKYGPQVQGYFWQVAYQVWIMRFISGNKLDTGTLVFSAPGNEEQTIFSVKCDDAIFTEIEKIILNAEIDIKDVVGPGTKETGEVKMNTELCVLQLSDLKGWINTVTAFGKQMKQEIDRRVKVITDIAIPEIDEKMQWLEENIKASDYEEGDRKIANLSMQTSQTIEIVNWKEVPDEMLKVTLSKTAANAYFKEHGKVPPGTEMVVKDSTISVRASTMASIKQTHYAFLSSAFIEEKKDE